MFLNMKNAIILALILWPAQGEGADERTLSVCEVFNNPDAYAGRVVRVHGELKLKKEYVSLESPECESQIDLGGRRWRRVINIVQGEAEYSATEVKADAASTQKVEQVLVFLHECQLKGFEVTATATFAGVLRIATQKARLQEPSSSAGPPLTALSPAALLTGFGHLGSFPAQLVYRTVTDITIALR